MKRIALLLVMPLAVGAQTMVNGGRIFKGTLDASGAASTLPYRTGTGSPSGRDACGKPGETYFQTDAPAGQNLWGCTASGSPGTWNQMTPGAIVGTGTAAPGGTCAAGSLYVRTDVQQFYICSSTNSWQLASYGTNVFASRPVNCVIGQVFLATDAGTLWYCSTPGNPGTWQPIGGTLTSVFGRTGVVTAQAGDYSAAQVTNAAQTNAGNTFTAGTQDFSGAGHTLPARVGTAASRPATCTQGEMYFAKDATPGQNWYYCTAANTWTAQSFPSAPVPSVFGRTGAVSAQAGDYTAAQVTNAAAVNAANTWGGGFLQNLSGDDLLLPTHSSDPASCTAGQIEFNSTSTSGQICTAPNTWTGLSTGGVTQLTGDVTAGPGSGSMAATVAKINGTSVPTNAGADQTIVTTASAVAAWASLANCVAAGGVLQYATATHSYSCHTLAATDIPAALPNTTSVNGTTIPASTSLMTTSTPLAAAQEPAHTGDVTNAAGSLAMTLATVNSASGTCGDASHVCQVTTNGKGLVTNQTTVAISAGGGNASIGQATVAFSATPAFTRTTNIMEFTISLTGNVTSSTLAGVVANDILIFQICQDTTGNRTFTWPAGFSSAATISPTASSCTRQQFVWDGANANLNAPATSTDTPFLISGALERAAPATPAGGVASLWPDSNRHTWTSVENNNANVHIMPRAAGATDQLALSDLSNGTAAGIVSLFTSCSGTQYLGADGACHTASGGSQTIANGTAALGTAAIASATCAGAVTVAASGVLGVCERYAYDIQIPYCWECQLQSLQQHGGFHHARGDYSELESRQMRPGARSQEPGASREGNRSLTVAALVLLVGGSAWAQSPSKLTNVTFSNSGNPSSAIDTTGATLIAVTVLCYDSGSGYPNDPHTPSDSKGNTWIPLASTRIVGTALAQETFIAYGAGLVVGAGHTFSGIACDSGFGWSAEVVAFSGTRTSSSPLDASTPVCGTSGGPLTVNLGSFTPSASNTLIFTVAGAFFGATANLTVTPGSLTIIDQILNGSAQVGASAYQTMGAPSALSVSWTGPANPSACVMAFDSAGAGSMFRSNQSVIVVGP